MKNEFCYPSGEGQGRKTLPFNPLMEGWKIKPGILGCCIKFEKDGYTMEVKRKSQMVFVKDSENKLINSGKVVIRSHEEFKNVIEDVISRQHSRVNE